MARQGKKRRNPCRIPRVLNASRAENTPPRPTPRELKQALILLQAENQFFRPVDFLPFAAQQNRPGLQINRRTKRLGEAAPEPPFLTWVQFGEGQGQWGLVLPGIGMELPERKGGYAVNVLDQPAEDHLLKLGVQRGLGVPAEAEKIPE